MNFSDEPAAKGDFFDGSDIPPVSEDEPMNTEVRENLDQTETVTEALERGHEVDLGEAADSDQLTELAELYGQLVASELGDGLPETLDDWIGLGGKPSDAMLNAKTPDELFAAINAFTADSGAQQGAEEQAAQDDSEVSQTDKQTSQQSAGANLQQTQQAERPVTRAEVAAGMVGNAVGSMVGGAINLATNAVKSTINGAKNGFKNLGEGDLGREQAQAAVSDLREAVANTPATAEGLEAMQREGMMNTLNSMPSQFADAVRSGDPEQLQAVQKDLSSIVEAAELTGDPALIKGLDNFRGAMESDQFKGDLDQLITDEQQEQMRELIEKSIDQIIKLIKNLLNKFSNKAPGEDAGESLADDVEQDQHESVALK